jgi:hypothetical protein
MDWCDLIFTVHRKMGAGKMKIGRILILQLAAVFLVGCGATSGMPQGAIAGCGDFGYTGTFTKSQTSMRALWLSDADTLARLSVEDVIALAEALGCRQ